MKLRLLPFLIPAVLHAGPYSGAAGTAGSEAIVRTDPRFVAWASGNSEITYGTDVDNTWKTPAKATGPATNNTLDIVCLGNGGRITMYFPFPLKDGSGADFAVFENSFSATFLELAFVEVSSDGVNFFRFPSASLTASAVGAFGNVDPTNIDGLAGKHQVGYGTPFDLATLPASPLLDKNHVCFVRIVDIIGNGATKDSDNRPIYDPTPTVGSGGFDLEAIGAININSGDFRMTGFTITGSTANLEWQSNPGSSYRIETSDKLDNWQPVETLAGSMDRGLTTRSAPIPAGPKRFWRVIRVGS
ncbi:hypothetical protein [Luteolibacter soli]|uniref:PEP-CTERM sorting domain-containing protein n=1 Tax=Luteolibacter soli TaxID=3135280 RepID=A0ABU9AS51_9BACT